MPRACTGLPQMHRDRKVDWTMCVCPLPKSFLELDLLFELYMTSRPDLIKAEEFDKKQMLYRKATTEDN